MPTLKYEMNEKSEEMAYESNKITKTVTNWMSNI